MNARSLLTGFAVLAALSGARGQEAKIDFVRDIQPILEFHCVSCHNADEAKADLRFDKASHFFKGGEGGPSLVKGKPDESLMIELVSLPKDDSDVMPPKGRPLNEAEIAKLRQWIAEGAAWPEELTLVARKEEDFKGPSLSRIAARSSSRSRPSPRTSPWKRRVISSRSWSWPPTRTTPPSTSRATPPSPLRIPRGRFEGPQCLHSQKGRPDRTHGEGRRAPGQGPGDGQGIRRRPPIDFHLDVMPVFMSEGCNIGACHGSARGQDGFMLSLFGYDPEGDHYRLTREMAGYRINLAIPEESLLVEKSIEAVPHTGGKLFEKGSDAYKTMVEWIANGATKRPGRGSAQASLAQPLPAEARPRGRRSDPAAHRARQILRWS